MAKGDDDDELNRIMDDVKKYLKEDSDLRGKIKTAVKQKERGLIAQIIIAIVRKIFGNVAANILEKVIDWFSR